MLQEVTLYIFLGRLFERASGDLNNTSGKGDPSKARMSNQNVKYANFALLTLFMRSTWGVQ